MNPFKLPHISGLLKPPIDAPLTSTILGLNPNLRQHLLTAANASSSSTSPQEASSLDTSRYVSNWSTQPTHPRPAIIDHYISTRCPYVRPYNSKSNEAKQIYIAYRV